jgi:osmotically-inducible protein OsmY
MKIRSAAASVTTAALALVFALGAAGCGKKDDNTNNANAAHNANTYANSNANTTSASEDTAIKNRIEANLSKAGVTGVTVEVSGGVATLKGDVPTAKFQDAVQAANEGGAKRVMNQLNKK